MQCKLFQEILIGRIARMTVWMDITMENRIGHVPPCAGMLLEQQKEAVLALLSEPSLLEEQVNLAVKTLQE